MPNRHPTQRRKNMQRYGGATGKYKVMRRAASDLVDGKHDTDCRGESPEAPQCPSPQAAPGAKE